MAANLSDKERLEPHPWASLLYHEMGYCSVEVVAPLELVGSQLLLAPDVDIGFLEAAAVAAAAVAGAVGIGALRGRKLLNV
ncbi:hypothetical protein Y1Q_0022440 [Alligator mississippiensis]|uniref:Uncharacterized protein n=1 Tax=Alligator mississippiensis TaxID=8496 RepID=A0A151N0F4_ALLMI|nr:hypothetical protein Y1Q_0022440 [Alligator mississippiensis]